MSTYTYAFFVFNLRVIVIFVLWQLRLQIQYFMQESGFDQSSLESGPFYANKLLTLHFLSEIDHLLYRNVFYI